MGLVQNGDLSAGNQNVLRTIFRTHFSPRLEKTVFRGLVLALRLIRCGHSAAERLMSVLNLPGSARRAPSSSHMKTLLNAALDVKLKIVN